MQSKRCSLHSSTNETRDQTFVERYPIAAALQKAIDERGSHMLLHVVEWIMRHFDKVYCSFEPTEQIWAMIGKMR